MPPARRLPPSAFLSPPQRRDAELARFLWAGENRRDRAHGRSRSFSPQVSARFPLLSLPTFFPRCKPGRAKKRIKAAEGGGAPAVLPPALMFSSAWTLCFADPALQRLYARDLKRAWLLSTHMFTYMVGSGLLAATFLVDVSIVGVTAQEFRFLPRWAGPMTFLRPT